MNRLALGQDMISGLDLCREGLQEGLSVLSAVEGLGVQKELGPEARRSLKHAQPLK